MKKLRYEEKISDRIDWCHSPILNSKQKEKIATFISDLMAAKQGTVSNIITMQLDVDNVNLMRLKLSLDSQELNWSENLKTVACRSDAAENLHKVYYFDSHAGH